MLGRPNCCEPVFMKIWAGAWLKASVTIDLTIATSSTTSPRCGSSSESSAPDWPCLLNLNLGASRVELGLMNAARYPLSRSAGGKRAVMLAEVRLVVEQVEVAGSPGLEQIR